MRFLFEATSLSKRVGADPDYLPSLPSRMGGCVTTQQPASPSCLGPSNV